MIVTDRNIAEARTACGPIDQRKELYAGAETWVIHHSGGQCGQMTIWPDTCRGAVCWGGDSKWGYWDAADNRLILDNEEGVVDACGKWVDDG